MHPTTSLRLAVMLVVGLAASGAAQTAPPEHDWSYGTTVNAFGGVSTDFDEAGALAGGGAGWEMTPRFALEGRLGWANGVGEGDTFAAALTLNASLLRPRPLVPFIKGGIGLYHASFGPSDEPPNFYRRRMNGSPATVTAETTFTDPTAVIGAGLNIFTSRHFAIRPEIGATFVLDGGHAYTVTTFTLHVAYHFESHPVTPSRAR